MPCGSGICKCASVCRRHRDGSVLRTACKSFSESKAEGEHANGAGNGYAGAPSAVGFFKNNVWEFGAERNRRNCRRVRKKSDKIAKST